MRLQTILCVLALAGSVFGQGGSGASKQEIAKLQKAYTAAKSDLARHPSSAAAKQAFCAAGNHYAMAAMTTSSMTPHQRYPLALKLYREVLKVEPTNREAKEYSDEIVAVYKQMHRPVPK